MKGGKLRRMTPDQHRQDTRLRRNCDRDRRSLRRSRVDKQPNCSLVFAPRISRRADDEHFRRFPIDSARGGYDGDIRSIPTLCHQVSVQTSGTKKRTLNGSSSDTTGQTLLWHAVSKEWPDRSSSHTVACWFPRNPLYSKTAWALSVAAKRPSRCRMRKFTPRIANPLQ